MSETSTTHTSYENTYHAQSAGTLRVVSSERNMKTYVITESELRNIALANTISSICFSIATGLWGYDLNLKTNFLFADKISPFAQSWINNVGPICWYGGFLFFFIAGIICLWRHSMVSLVKTENSSANNYSENRLLKAIRALRGM